MHATTVEHHVAVHMHDTLPVQIIHDLFYIYVCLYRTFRRVYQSADFEYLELPRKHGMARCEHCYIYDVKLRARPDYRLPKEQQSVETRQLMYEYDLHTQRHLYERKKFTSHLAKSRYRQNIYTNLH